MVYRLQFSDQYQEVDARFIQTNLSIEEARTFAKGRGLRKYRALPDESFERDKVDAEASIEIYEEIFAPEARMSGSTANGSLPAAPLAAA